MTDTTRAHHMKAKYMLASSALQDPVWFVNTFAADSGEEALRKYWRLLGEDLPDEDRVEGEGLQVDRVRLGADGPKLLVLTLPAPQRRNEAYYLAAALLPGKLRFFCLESSLSAIDGSATTVLAELAPEGRYNWGPGSVAQVRDFVESLGALLSDADARPLSFVEMQLA
ncbi:hypothetical protein [Lysobacter capsici]|uniref:hypothetical protein n=1 Tax=Lysobacter capsici TaxID=435897 RepID=UPI001C0077A5|nr:hypothetical protein [Lysobacter capsici]QWF16287.1 hypothetical protein KME82_21430 [Lysobacter capsici]